MAIQFLCSQCGQPIEVDDEHAGRTAACPYCHQVVGVPPESTYRPASAGSARPATGTASAESPGWSAGPARTEPGGLPARHRVALTFGSYALVCTVLAVVMLGAAVIGSTYVMMRSLGGHPPTELTREQLEKAQTAVMRHPWIPVIQVGGLFFAVVGLALGIVSLTQRAAGNWRGISSVIVCGLLVVCLCGSVVFSLATGMGMPAGG